MPRGGGASRAGKRASPAQPRQKHQSQETKVEKPQDAEASIPLALQQKCLNLFRDVLKPGPSDAETLQEVKSHLFNRDFAAAFSKEEYLNVYAGRWSPSRALGYAEIFRDIREHISASQQTNLDRPQSLKVTCLGGAGAELVALAAYMHHLLNNAEAQSNDDSRTEPSTLEAYFVDIANWSPITTSLHVAVTTAPTISKYASAAVKAANIPLLPPDTFHAHFKQQDILSAPDSTISELCADAQLVTLLFTLNELYSTTISKTQHLLTQLTAAMQSGALLLVVDSPGSYSTVSVNGAEKKYPMHWLLDLTLLGSKFRSDGGEEKGKWEKVVEDQSRWFRLPPGLEYPIALENMRYQIHLYRRIGDVID